MAGSALPETTRAGSYFRVCKPDWHDAGDWSYAKRVGGRWNPAGEFGALYLNATIRVAAAQARHQHVGRAIGLFDLLPSRRPQLARFDVPRSRVVDAVSDRAIADLGLSADYPIGTPWSVCQEIARRAYAATLAGIAARSNAEWRPGDVVGEELAYFDSQAPLKEKERQTFAQWYPDPYPT